MNKSVLKKRPFYVGVFYVLFCLTACSQPKRIPTQSEPRYQEALITMQQLLGTADFRQGIKSAVAKNDIEAIQRWQSDLLAVAKEARMSASDIKTLSGSNGITFLQFHGKRLNYNDEFFNRLLAFEDLQPLFDRFPHFDELHDISKKMQIQRDDLISQRITQLAQRGVEGDLQAIARGEWRDYFKGQSE